MANDIEKIVSAVENTIKVVEKAFAASPTNFYTEDDVRSFFYFNLVKSDCPLTAIDKDKKPHFLVHTEYATPFKCSMKEKFELRADDSKSKRGHYDMVILNPEFIEKNSFLDIRNQNYFFYKSNILNKLAEQPKPVVAYGLEFMFLRDPVKFKAKDEHDRTVYQVLNEVIKDADKLKAANEKHPGFMGEMKMLFYVSNNPQDIDSYINYKLKDRKDVSTFFAK